MLMLCLVNFSLLQAKENYYAGYKQIKTNKGKFEPFPIAVWYPTKQLSKKEHLGLFKLNISLRAKTAEGKFPLILISHGSGGSIHGHRDTAQYLAENGYIVAALLHPRNNYKDNRDEAATENWINRPKHIRIALDIVLEYDKFSNHIEKNKIAVIGHSAGGYTALALVGGIADTKEYSFL